MAKKRKKKTPKVNTPSKTSPKGLGNVCMCPDGSYSEDCCNGDIIAQGIGKLDSGTSVVRTSANGVRTISRS